MTYLKQDRSIDDRQYRGEQHGQSPIGGDSVQHGHAQVTGEVEQVDHGGKNAAELGLTHLSAVRQ